jgi:uncharacterized membrane protein (UPF0127 family)
MGIIAERWIVNESVHLEVQRAIGLRRLTGLIGHRPLGEGSALRFARCRGVHGVGMRRPLDVVFARADGHVTSVRRLDPWSFVSDRRADECLELRAGEAARLGIVVGSQLKNMSIERVL